MPDRREFLQGAGTLSGAALATTAIAAAGDNTTQTVSNGPGPGAQTPPPAIQNSLDDQDKHPPPADMLGADTREALLDKKYQLSWRTTKLAAIKAAAEKVSPNDPIVAWLKVFANSFDDIASATVLNAAKSVSRPGSAVELCYEPQLFEGALRSASTLLDRCLSYRREMGEFEVSGVKAALDYITFVQVNPVQRTLMRLANDSDVAGVQKDYQVKAQNSYTMAASSEKIAQGHAYESGGAATAASVTELKEGLKTKYTRRQFDLTVEAQLAQFTRYITPGSASNMAERYLRLRALLEEDLSDAYRKLYCASIGVASVLGLTSLTLASSATVNTVIPLFSGANGTSAAISKWIQPFVSSQNGQRAPDIVDALVIWTRAVLREIDRRSQYESDVTVSIPICQPSGSHTTPLLTTAQVKAAITAANGNAVTVPAFTLAADSLPFSVTFAALRVVGIGLSLVHSIDDAVPFEYTQDFPPDAASPPNPTAAHTAQVPKARLYTEPKWARFNAVVKTPPQNVASVGSYARPPVLLANVRLQGGTGGDLEPTLSMDPGAHNINPFGSWSVSVDLKDVVWYGNDSTPQAVSTLVSGLILHLRLRGSAT
jgi:hypothetical protein